MLTGVGHHAPDGIELLEAWEDHRLAFVQRSVRQEHLLGLEVQKIADDVEQHLAREDGATLGLVRPNVCGAVFPCDVGVAGSLVSAAVEWEEAGLPVHESCRHRDVGGVHGEVNERAALEGQQRFVGRRTILAILFLGVPKGGSGEFVLQLEGRDRDAVDEDHDVDRVLIAAAVMDLSRDRENVGFVASLESRVDVRGRLEGT